MRLHIDAELNRYDLTLSQLQVLKCIEDAGGETTQKEIERQLGVSHPTVVGLISRLEKSGYVTTCPGSGKQKSKQITVTSKGKDQRYQIKAHHAETEKTLMRGLSDDETEKLRQMLERIAANISLEWADHSSSC